MQDAFVASTENAIHGAFVDHQVKGLGFKLAHICDVHNFPQYVWSREDISPLHLIDHYWAYVYVYLVRVASIIQVFAELCVATPEQEYSHILTRQMWC